MAPEAPSGRSGSSRDTVMPPHGADIRTRLEQAGRTDEYESAPSRIVHALDVGLLVAAGSQLFVPPLGPTVVVVNRPFGGVLEPVLLGVWLAHFRSNVLITTNDLLGDIPRLRQECVVFGDVNDPSTRAETSASFNRLRAALAAGACAVLAPASISPDGWLFGFSDARWPEMAVALAAEAHALLVPACVRGSAELAAKLLAPLHPRVGRRFVLNALARLVHTNLRVAFGRPVPSQGERISELNERLRQLVTGAVDRQAPLA